MAEPGGEVAGRVAAGTRTALLATSTPYRIAWRTAMATTR
jgi:hypothetical protein